jgi:hypothetical protein
MTDMLSVLSGDLISRIAAQLEGGDRICFRLTCAAFRDNSTPATVKPRAHFLRTVGLAELGMSDPTFPLAAIPPYTAPAFQPQGRSTAVRMCALAASAGSAAVLDWLRDVHGYSWDRETCAAAAAAGHLDLLRHARAQGCAWDWTTAARAAEAGRLDTLQWALDNGCPPSWAVCQAAARGGQLAVLQWLRSDPVLCEWDWRCTMEAAAAGDRDLFRWLVETGCPVTSSACAAAAQHGHLELLQDAVAWGCPYDPLLCRHLAINQRTPRADEVAAWASGSIANGIGG